MHRHAHLSALLLGLVAAGLSGPPVNAQVVREEGLVDWTHAGGPPEWTDDVPEPTSLNGTVDRLNSSTNLAYASNPLMMQPGKYVMAIRIRKFMDQNGVAPLTVSVIGGSTGLIQSTLEAADQPTDTWVWTPEILFEVQVASPIQFTLDNVDPSITKQNYDFDTFVVGRTDDDAILYEDLGRNWGHAWGSPYYSKEEPDQDSALGYVEKLNYVWWFDWNKSYTLQPGIYTANIRMKKLTSPVNAQDMTFRVRIGGQTVDEVVSTAADHAANLDTYIYTPKLSFEVTAPNTQVDFRFTNTSGSRKDDYHFDAFVLRSGWYGNEGEGCASSTGEVELDGTPPYVGGVFEATVRNVVTAGVVNFGTATLSVDLGRFGAPGCTLYTDSLAAAPVGPAGTLTVPVPNDPALVGAQLRHQALVIDPSANTLGIASSNARVVRIGG